MLNKQTVSFYLLLTVSIQVISAQGKLYGEKLTLEKPTSIAGIFNNPENYVDKKVLIEGQIIDVCQHMGCWITIASDQDSIAIKVKVDDGVIVFPKTSKGHKASVEGIVEKLHFTKEELLESEKHQAEEQGKQFNPDDVVIKEKTIYQIRGLGAIIEE